MICELENEEFNYYKFLDIFCAQLSDKNYYCLICEKEQRIFWVLNLRFEAPLHHANYIAEIMGFVINPLCRNMGLGKEMFERAGQVARELGCVQIEVTSNELREGMQNCHFKFSKQLL
ncbi:MAG: GNAT family N-acetyltransferase [Oscillospiraceae bacterium]